MANLVTLSRIPLLGLVIWLLYSNAASAHYTAAGLTFMVIAMDTLDGVLARARGETSVLGSVLDIAADRSVEYLLWVVYAHLGLISVLIPLIVILRGTFVDTIRSIAPAQGLTPFDLTRAPLSRFLVKSPVMRTGYALAKITAFVGLAIARGMLTAQAAGADSVLLVMQGIVWLAVAICLARGLPVLIEAPRALQAPAKH